MTPARLLVIQHADDCSPAWFGEWLSAAGCRLDVISGHLGEEVPETLAGYDGLVVLGGEMGAYDDTSHPWLTPTKALISTVVASGRWFLGICLGHQLACVALGGEVVTNPTGLAIGLRPVALTREGQLDELFGPAVQDGSTCIQWNADVASLLPEGAVSLATAADGTVQAARFSARAWGLQFHPECSPPLFDEWASVASDTQPPNGILLPDLVTEIYAAESLLRANWEPLARRFAQLVGTGVGVA